MPEDLVTVLAHEGRLRAVEERMATHEAVCTERYTNIVNGQKATQQSVDQLNTVLRDNTRYMLWALIALALASVFGPDLAAKLIGGR